MTNIKEHIASNQNWTNPGITLSKEDFLSGIKDAESSPCQSVQQSMDNFEKWLKSREKK